MTEVVVRIQIDDGCVEVIDATPTREPPVAAVKLYELPDVAFDELTPREHEVLEYLCAGFNNSQIGAAMTITVRTARSYVARIGQVAECSSSRRIIALALVSGYVDPERVLEIWRDAGHLLLTEDAEDADD